MFKKLRIIFCVIAVALCAACIFVFVYAGIAYGIICLAAAIVCYFLMLYFKKRQEQQDGIDNPPPPEGDFISGRIPAEDASERFAAMNSAVTIEDENGETRTFIIVKGDKDTFDKVGVNSSLGKAVWFKKIGDEITYNDSALKETTVKIINIE